MGMFTSVLAKVKCEICGRDCEVEIQFKHGDDCCHWYKDGDKSDACIESDYRQETHAIPPGEYDGIYESVCEPCEIQRRRDDIDRAAPGQFPNFTHSFRNDAVVTVTDVIKVSFIRPDACKQGSCEHNLDGNYYLCRKFACQWLKNRPPEPVTPPLTPDQQKALMEAVLRPISQPIYDVYKGNE